MEKSLYANNWLSASGTNHYSYYLDPDSFADQFWIVEFTKQIDGYRLSTFFQKDRNGRVKPEPIFNWGRGFGNASFLDGAHFKDWYYTQLGPPDHPWAYRLIRGNPGSPGAGDPDFCQKIADRWGILRTNVLYGPRVVSRIDKLAAFLTEAAARDFARFPRLGNYIWPNPTSPPFDVDYVAPTTYAGVISEMKKWVSGRYSWLETQFTAAPTFSQPGGLVTNDTAISLIGPPQAVIYYTLDGRDPRAPGGEIAPSALIYDSPVTINANIQIFARARKSSGSWQNTWSPPSLQTFFTKVPGLRISEIMYHPASAPPGSSSDPEDYEYIEVQNIAGTPLNLNGFQFAGGVQFIFPNLTLDAGQHAVVVRNISAFQSRYGTSTLILGEFAGHLNNAGDHLLFSGPARESILDFSFADDWYPATDGQGFSLVTANATSDPAGWNLATAWRASSAIGGSPGAVDPPPPARPRVLVNELLSYSATHSDAIELYNAEENEANIGGWFLSDDFNAPRKFVIPAGTIIPAGGYRVFTESDFNPGGSGFAFGSKSDSAYLFSGNGVDLTGYVHGYQFGVAEQDVTFGRYVTSTGEDHLVAQRSNTLGAANSQPLVGPVVISEIHYHPADVVIGTAGLDNVADEFIELQNITSESVPLFDPLHTINSWQIRDGVDFDFPAGATIPAGNFALVVGFDPVSDTDQLSRFRQSMQVPFDVPIYGPWHGRLENAGGGIKLLKPRAPEADEVVPYILVEGVRFGDRAGSLAGANGLGVSLHRIEPADYGDDPTNWTAAAPNPGSRYAGGQPPAIVSQPADQIGFAGSNVTFRASATGSGPLTYQWRFMGEPLDGATSSNLVINDFQLSQAGVYNVLVYNGAGYALGNDFTVVGRIALGFTVQPQNAAILAGGTTNFAVSAVGMGPLRYQWYRNGNPFANATNSTLTVTNVQVAVEGNYTCIIQDDYTTLASDIATLEPLFKPGIILQPLSLAAVEGGSAYFSVVCTGSVPIYIRWRAQTNFTGLALTLASQPVISGLSNSVLIFTNLVYTTNVLRITAVMTNLAGGGPIKTSALLTILRDSDHDGLPDSWETNRAGFSISDPSDGARDDDRDGMSNADEYVAGTDFANSASYLKIETLSSGIGRLQFTAVSNRTYTVQYTDNLSPIIWHKLADVLARNVTRTETVIDPNATTNRFYRLVIPIQP